MTQPPIKPLTGRRVFLYFLAFFGLITAVLATLTTLAVRTHTGIVTQHPYEEGLAYNKTVAAYDQQQQLGWKGMLTTTPLPNGKLEWQVHLVVKDAAGAQVPMTNVIVKLSRPVDARGSFDATLLPASVGEGYSANVIFPLAGVWEVRAYARSNDDTYQIAKRVVIE